MSAAEEVVAGRKKDMASNCLMVLLYEFEEKVGRFPLLATIVPSGHARPASTFSFNYVSVPVLMVPYRGRCVSARGADNRRHHVHT